MRKVQVDTYRDFLVEREAEAERLKIAMRELERQQSQMALKLVNIPPPKPKVDRFVPQHQHVHFRIVRGPFLVERKAEAGRLKIAMRELERQQSPLAHKLVKFLHPIPTFLL